MKLGGKVTVSTMPWRRMGLWRYNSTFLGFGIRWRWVVSFTPCSFTLGVRAPGTHWIGSWVGTRVGLDAVEKRKILLCREWNPDRPARSPLLYRLQIRRFKDKVFPLRSDNSGTSLKTKLKELFTEISKRFSALNIYQQFILCAIFTVTASFYSEYWEVYLPWERWQQWNVFYFWSPPQWLFQPVQGPGLLFSSVIIFHRRYDSLDEWSARRKAST
jgi:hypothetical protein